MPHHHFYTDLQDADDASLLFLQRELTEVLKNTNLTDIQQADITRRLNEVRAEIARRARRQP